MATLNDNALTTLSNAKLYLGISNDSQDDLVTELINKTTDFMEGFCGRTFKLTSYVEKYDGSGTDKLLLNNFPVIGSVTLDENSSGDATDDWTTASTNDYWIYDEKGYLQLVSGDFGERPNGWRVTYEAGYRVQGAVVTGEHVKLPDELELACWKLMAGIYNLRKSEGTSQQTLGDYRVSFMDIIDQDSTIKTVLDNYKNPAL